MAYYGNPQYSSNAGDGNHFYAQSAYNNSTTSQQQQHPAYNSSSWQPQATQQQQSTYPSQPIGPSIFNPSVAGAFGNQAVQKMMMDQGQAFVLEGMAKIVPGLEVSMITLRAYFAVDNQYVLKKIKKVLFPFLSRTWSRQIKQYAGPDTPPLYELPTMDENAPDLYLPSMTLITYVLLCAICYGGAGQFSPEVIPDVTTKCFLTQTLEVLAIRVGFYMMQAPVAFLDLFSYTGYKYLGLCVNLLVGMMASQLEYGTKAYYVSFCWTATAAAYFMLKTMANNIPLETSSSGPKRELVVVVIAAAQLATIWFVGQTKFL
ncbi:hypothetical protein FisN_5Lh040 [Fistulifera solaris]|uniref:Protein YIF1 n=1 Tax=Fistulifera solaris TaxID=1519565 RepID=A0A1Z5JJ44_FISSO|nr:hypothetical protein FisN_5Lh040 [Fistulifera solaris]|eukprot:GAX14037.1 hypothetical protein FisN_5Lh040 [Fistulifera solaris]